MKKTCKYCEKSKPLSLFCYHPTAKYQKSHICKKCACAAQRKRYRQKLASAGKTLRVPSGVIKHVEKKTHKFGDKRRDGMVFWAAMRNKLGLYEYWVTREKFAIMKSKLMARNAMKRAGGY